MKSAAESILLLGAFLSGLKPNFIYGELTNSISFRHQLEQVTVDAVTGRVRFNANDAEGNVDLNGRRHLYIRIKT